METMDVCKQHSGCLSDIENLKASDSRQWLAIDEIRGLSTKILGGMVVSIVLLLINILVSAAKGGLTP